MRIKSRYLILAVVLLLLFCQGVGFAALDSQNRQGSGERFSWWPTDAAPAPVKDEVRGGYWWWPNKSGSVGPLWGNRGYCYINKVIFDYKEEELPAPKPQELRPSLLIKKIIKNVKIYFDYNSALLREDAVTVLKNAVRALKSNPEADILVTGNCDIRGSETYNDKLGRQRAGAVKQFILDQGIGEDRVRIISRGKLDAIAKVNDLKGMQKDRNAQFMVAEVEEVLLPYTGPVEATQDTQAPVSPQQEEPVLQIPQGAEMLGEGKFLIEEEETIEGEIKVSTREYTVLKGDSLSKIAKEQLGAAHRWKYLYELNKDRIKDPNKLRAGQKIIIPVE